MEPGALRSAALARAAATVRPIESLDTDEAFGEAGARALSFLAVEWLAERAGEHAIVEYYPGSARRRDGKPRRAGVRATFGIATGEFYEAFAEYRADLVPPNEAAYPS